MLGCGAILIAAVLGLVNCVSAETEERWGVHRYKRIRWQEQVQLSTGQVIVVERGARLRLAYGGQLPLGWLFDEAWLEANLPSVGITRWEGALSPLVLDVTPSGKWYLLGIVVASRGRKDYDLPEHKRYVAFRLQGNSWKRVPFAEFPESFQPNLLANTGRLFGDEQIPPDEIIDLETKRRVDSDRTLGKAYKRIDRSLGE